MYKTERRRDGQQWILDWMVKTTGRVQNFANDEREVPNEVKSYRMIPRAHYKRAKHYETMAAAAEERGHKETAALLYMKACDEYRAGQHSIFQDDHAEKIYMHRKHMECFDRAIVCTGATIDTVEIPWEGVTIQGRFHVFSDRRPAPTVLFLPGMDMTKEAFPSPINNPFLKRGMNVLAIDGPGQGISNIRKIRVTHDNYERAASACIDWLVRRPEVLADQIAVVGASFGSHWGTRLAAIDHRVKALATSHACYGPKVQIFEEASPRFKQMFMYMAGVHDEDAFDAMAAKMGNEEVGKDIICPTLMITGEYDPLCHLEDALDLFEDIAGPKEMWVFENEFHRTSLTEGIAFLEIYPFEADWICDALRGRVPPPSGVIRIIRQKEGLGPYEPGDRPLYLPGRYE